MKIWIAYETDGCEAASAIGYFLSRESAVRCCEEEYFAKQEEREEAYGPNSERPSSHMLWPLPMQWVDDGLWQEHDGGKSEQYSEGFFVGSEPVEVLP